MELRQLRSETDRQMFAKRLAEARATRGFGFKDCTGARLGDAHLTFGDLYAIYEDESSPAETMQAGFAVHNLATLPQSYPQPDLTHIPPQYVLEGGELWSLSPGAGRIARLVAAAIAGIMQARAILIYAIAEPVDIRRFYLEDGFSDIGSLVEWP
ncbi:MAG TPA: hypothetical protein VEJ86_11700, partial [Candidatus Binataceae bacterium]|nr:hypothetical protein [Candidatus Binataceae bacterium]